MGAKFTLELDDATVGSLQELASAWGTPPEQAIVRVVQDAVTKFRTIASDNSPLLVFRQLQRDMALTPRNAEAWKSEIYEGRR